jgi:hypothetical protein
LVYEWREGYKTKISKTIDLQRYFNDEIEQVCLQRSYSGGDHVAKAAGINSFHVPYAGDRESTVWVVFSNTYKKVCHIPVGGIPMSGNGCKQGSTVNITAGVNSASITF